MEKGIPGCWASAGSKLLDHGPVNLPHTYFTSELAPFVTSIIMLPTPGVLYSPTTGVLHLTYIQISVSEHPSKTYTISATIPALCPSSISARKGHGPKKSIDAWKQLRNTS